MLVTSYNEMHLMSPSQCTSSKGLSVLGQEKNRAVIPSWGPSGSQLSRWCNMVPYISSATPGYHFRLHCSNGVCGYVFLLAAGGLFGKVVSSLRTVVTACMSYLACAVGG
jgi:hypothetical protein